LITNLEPTDRKTYVYLSPNKLGDNFMLLRSRNIYND